MKILVIKAIGWLLLLSFSMATISANEKERFCHNYADSAVDQYYQAKRNHLPGINPPAWSDDRNGHYMWCMVTPENIANSESAKRQAHLRQAHQNLDNKMKQWEQLDNRQTDNGMGAGMGQGGVNGIEGMSSNPGGSAGAGRGNQPPPFENDNGLGDIYGNKAGHRPDDHIVEPDQMGQVDTGSPAANIYGPGGKPLPGYGGVSKGKGGTATKFVKKPLDEMALIFGGDLLKLAQKLEDRGISTDIDGLVATNKGIQLYFIKIKFKKATLTLVFDITSGKAKLDDSKKSAKSLDDSGEKGGQNPLSEREKQMIEDVKASGALDDILKYIPIQNDGGVVDPMYNQARGSGQGSEKNSGHSASHGKTPKVAKQPGSHRPGSDLTGPGRIDRPGVGKSVKLPQGFHVIDPAARRGTVYDRAGSVQKIHEESVKLHRVK